LIWKKEAKKLTSENRLRVLIGPCFLLGLIYLVWFVRYPIWQSFGFIEPVFLLLIASYFIVLILSLLFLKKDAKKLLSQLFKIRNRTTLLFGLFLAFLFQIAWFSVYLLIGGKLELLSFPSLEEYVGYAFYSVPSAFALYLAFAVFGAFVEEVTFRGYIQSRISSKFGSALGIFVATFFFSLQHIHIFNVGWIETFFQTQFISVFCFGIFVGYFFIKSGEDLWSAIAFHCLMNVFNVLLPVKAASEFLIFNHAATIITFILLILLLRITYKKRNFQ